MQSNIVQVFTRVFVDTDDVDKTSLFYQTLFGGQEAQRFLYEETGLLIVSLTSPSLSVLIIGGSEKIESLLKPPD